MWIDKQKQAIEPNASSSRGQSESFKAFTKQIRTLQSVQCRSAHLHGIRRGHKQTHARVAEPAQSEQADTRTCLCLRGLDFAPVDSIALAVPLRPLPKRRRGHSCASCQCRGGRGGSRAYPSGDRCPWPGRSAGGGQSLLCPRRKSRLPAWYIRTSCGSTNKNKPSSRMQALRVGSQSHSRPLQSK